MKVLMGPWVSGDETISTPNEIRVFADGKAIACHADQGDVTYASLAELESAYWIDVSADIFFAAPLNMSQNVLNQYLLECIAADANEYEEAYSTEMGE